MNNIETGIILADIENKKCIKSTEIASLICCENEPLPEFVLKTLRKSDRRMNTTLNGRDYLIFQSDTIDTVGLTVFTVTDITEINKMNLENRIINKSLEYVQDAVYAIDKDGNELVLNKIERFMPVYKDKLINEMKQVFTDGHIVSASYNKYITLDHKEIHMLSTLVPVKENGEVIAVLLINRYLNRVQETLKRAQNLQVKTNIRNQKKLPDNKQCHKIHDKKCTKSIKKFHSNSYSGRNRNRKGTLCPKHSQ